MKIRHRDYGEVDGVDKVWNVINGHHWQKHVNGHIEIYVECRGWREVKEPQYVDVTWNLKIEGRDLTLYGCGGLARIFTATKVLPDNYRLKMCYWFDLPENLLHDIHSMTVKGFIEYIQRFKKPCLIVEKEEGNA